MTPTPDDWQRWELDPVAFIEETLTPTGCKPGEWHLSPYQGAAVRKLLADDAPHVTCWLWSKRSLKSTLACGCAIWLSLFGGDGLRSVFGSTSERAAGDVMFREARRMLEQSAPLRGMAEVQTGLIRFPQTGSTIETLPCSVQAVAGVSVSGLYVQDEGWCAPRTEPDELLRNQAENGRVLYTSQAAGYKSHLRRFFELWESGQADPKELHVDYFQPTEQLLSPNPRIDRAYLAARKLDTNAALYKAYWENAWRSGADSVWTAEQLAAVVADYRLPTTRAEWLAMQDELGGTFAVGSGLDRSLPYSKHADRSCYATVGRRVYELDGEQREEFLVLQCDVLRAGTREDVAAAHAKADAIFGPRRSHFEVYNAGDIAAELGAELIHGTAAWQATTFDRFYRYVAEARLYIAEECKELLAELEGFGCELETTILPRWGAMSGGRDDTVYATAHALCAASEAPLGSGGFYVYPYTEEKTSSRPTEQAPPGLSPGLAAWLGY